MGIPSYFAHIVRKHRSIIKHITAVGTVDNFYLDCNSLIYDAVHKLPQNAPALDQAIITEVCQTIIEYIHLVKPTQRLFIAFDGVAPMAKLNQQRKRRFCQPPNPVFHTAAITPGTAFMRELGLQVTQRFTRPTDFGLHDIIVSGSDQCGEGEHKIYDYIRSHQLYHSQTCTVVYGLDADLIMLTLHHLDIAPRMFLFRETPEFIKHLDRSLNPKTNYILDIPELAERLADELSPLPQHHRRQGRGRTATGATARKKQRMTLIYDYVFLCFMLGNDFLPHFPALNIRTNGITLLIHAYLHVFGKKQHLTLTENKTSVCWPNVRLLLEYLAGKEHDYLKEEYHNRNKQTQRLLNQPVDPKDPLLDLPMRDRRVEHYINVEELGWETRYYKILLDMTDEDRKRTLCHHYMQGLEWTLAYYGENCPDWRWSYAYDYPPLLCDLLKYIPFQHHTVLLPKQAPKPVSPEAQLLYVLPPHAVHLLPPAIAPFSKNIVNETVHYQYAFCKFLWEAHVHLPELSMTDIERDLLKK